ncbi:PREDICTED: uncharacterized protein LOC108548381 [Eufriesea mexicana]|uniref:uncharacterized protein LOC108548381 n=1 Tax=Eufriesea mexicana TaxID=516756 RepID=UPI00083BB7D5|nr:PREDICTED: uncharacterized protein LOC108548381 [Eufriesea mexicana]
MFILTFLSTVLILSRGNARRTVDGFNMDSSNWDPFLFISKDLNESPNYDITCWLFVELRSIPSESKVLDSSGVGEFFLGICPCLTLHTWDLCSLELTRQRKADCTFNEATPYSNTSARVHRRLCDITSLAESTSSCNCSISIAGQALYKTEGFPTCFLNPLPESLCSPRGICGIAQCTATTIKGIHTPQCASNCHHRQPFCEEIGPSTSIPAEINSLWSRWSSPKCNSTCGRGFLVAIASCQDQRKSSHRLYRTRIILVSQRSFREVPSNSLTMTKGVNFSSCPDSFSKCYCEVNMVDGIMRAARFTEPCISTEGCISSNVRTFTFEGELDPGNNIDFDEAYENDDRERFEDTLCPPESARVVKRNLLQAASADQEEEYVLRENRLANKNFKGIHGYRSVLRSRLGDDADYSGQNEDDDEDDDEEGDEKSGPGDGKADEDDEEEEDDENSDENSDETIGHRGSAKGRRSPRKHTRETRSDYAAIAFEGKQEVDEPERKGPMEIRSATEECEDDSTEPLRYYDYESARGTSLAFRTGLALELVVLGILFWFLEH